MANTEKLNLELEELQDIADVEVLNQNFQKIDNFAKTVNELTFNTLQEALNNQNLVLGNVITTLGLTTKNDGGGREYIVQASNDGSNIVYKSGIWFNKYNGATNLEKGGYNGTAKQLADRITSTENQGTNLQNQVNNKQNAQDNSLNTDSKTMVGGINEVNSKKLNKGSYTGTAEDLKTEIDKKQKEDDNRLNTYSKKVWGAINELWATFRQQGSDLTNYLLGLIDQRTLKGTYSGTAGQLKAMIDSLATTGTITPIVAQLPQLNGDNSFKGNIESTLSEDIPVFKTDLTYRNVRVGGMFNYLGKTLTIPTGVFTWVKIGEIQNNSDVSFKIKTYSASSEEMIDLKLLGTYHPELTGILVKRQTYSPSLQKIRVCGEYGGIKTVYGLFYGVAENSSVAIMSVSSTTEVVVNNIIENPPPAKVELDITTSRGITSNFEYDVKGNIKIQKSSTVALDVQNDAGSSFLKVDTINNAITSFGDSIEKVIKVSAEFVDTGITVNSFVGGRTIIVMNSTHFSTGNGTLSGYYMVRCGYDGNNYSVTTIAESGDQQYGIEFGLVGSNLAIKSKNVNVQNVVHLKTNR